MAVFSLPVRVNYDDIDRHMRLTLKGALGYMQEAAMIHSAQAGYSAGDVERTHVVWMLVQWRARLLEPVFWNENLLVSTWPRTMERATSVRCFEIRREDGTLAAIGESNWVLVNADTGRIMRIPKVVSDAYDLTDKGVFEDPLPDLPISEGELAYRSLVQRRDIDTNLHVNNRVYLDYALEALPEEAASLYFKEVSIRYRKQLLPGQHFSCYCCGREDLHIVEIYGDTAGEHHATVVFRI